VTPPRRKRAWRRWWPIVVLSSTACLPQLTSSSLNLVVTPTDTLFSTLAGAGASSTAAFGGDATTAAASLPADVWGHEGLQKTVDVVRPSIGATTFSGTTVDPEVITSMFLGLFVLAAAEWSAY